MMEKKGTLTTKIICNDDQTHVYEICREFDTEGEEIILLTLFPTVTEPNKCDLSGLHMLNHASDEGLELKKIHFVFLFSKVSASRLSTKGLRFDTENMDYLRNLFTKLSDAKIVISFGASMDKCPAVIESKVRLFQIIKELRAEEALWQISADGMEEESPHILFAGIRYGNEKWSLCHYRVPHRFTKEGYDLYLANKEEARQRFIKNVLEVKKEAQEKPEKQGKGKKKDANQKS